MDHYTKLVKAIGRRKPYIDLEELVRNGDEGKAVDVWLHVPQVASATFTAASMVVALITMMWRKPSFIGWSVVGAFDNEGMLYGYPCLGYFDLQFGAEVGLDTMILPYDNRVHVLRDLQDRHKRPGAHYDFQVKEGKEHEMIFRTWVKDEEEGDGDAAEEKKSEGKGQQQPAVFNHEVRVVFCQTMMEVVHEVVQAWRVGWK